MSNTDDDNRDVRPLASAPCFMHEVDPQYMGLVPDCQGALDPAALAELGSALLNGLPDAIVYADHAGNIRFWNHGAQRIFGFTTAEATGQSLDIIIPRGLRARHWQGYHHMMSTGESRHSADEILAVPALNKQGKTLSIQFTVAPVAGQDGALTGIVALIRDVTETFNELKRLRATRT